MSSTGVETQESRVTVIPLPLLKRATWYCVSSLHQARKSFKKKCGRAAPIDSHATLTATASLGGSGYSPGRFVAMTILTCPRSSKPSSWFSSSINVRWISLPPMSTYQHQRGVTTNGQTLFIACTLYSQEETIIATCMAWIIALHDIDEPTTNYDKEGQDSTMVLKRAFYIPEQSSSVIFFLAHGQYLLLPGYCWDPPPPRTHPRARAKRVHRVSPKDCLSLQ